MSWLGLALPHRALRGWLAGLTLALIGMIFATSTAQAEDTSDPYVVAVGDTLFSISRRSGVAVEELVALNTLADPNRLVAGQVLRLSAPSRSVLVQPGDTLYAI